MIVVCGFRRFVSNACPQIHDPHQCIYHVYTSMFLKFRYHYIKINLITTKLLPMDQGNFCYPQGHGPPWMKMIPQYSHCIISCCLFFVFISSYSWENLSIMTFTLMKRSFKVIRNNNCWFFWVYVYGRNINYLVSCCFMVSKIEGWGIWL